VGEIYLTHTRIIVILKYLTTILRIMQVVRHLATFLQRCVVNYASGVPDTPSPSPTSFEKKKYTLIIVEIGFCRDLGCDIKLEKKNEKILVGLRRYWGRVDFIAFPIGHAGTTLARFLDQLTTAFSTVRLTVERSQPYHGPQCQDARLQHVQVDARLVHGLSPISHVRHHYKQEALSRYSTRQS